MIKKNNTQRTLTETQVVELRKKFAERGTFEGYTQYARELGIPPTTFFNVITGYTYKNVGGPISLPAYMANMKIRRPRL